MGLQRYSWFDKLALGAIVANVVALVARHSGYVAPALCARLSSGRVRRMRVREHDSERHATTLGLPAKRVLCRGGQLGLVV